MDGKRSLNTTASAAVLIKTSKKLSVEDLRSVEYKRELLNIEQRKIQIS